MTPMQRQVANTSCGGQVEGGDLLSSFQRAVAFSRAHGVFRFFHRPARTLAYYALLRGYRALPIGLPIQARTFFGAALQVVPSEESARQLWYYGFIEEDVTWFFLTHLRPGMTCIDVGANVGYFTLLAARLVGSSGTVHAFEPARQTCATLCHNTRRHPHVTVQQQALWSHQTVMPFYDYGVKYSTLNSLRKHRLIREERIETHRSYDVPCVSLDAYCREGAIVPHFIKIDAEVSEPEILRGSSHIIARHKPIISLEVWDDGARHSREDITFLLEQGYRGVEYHAGALIPHRLRDRYEYANVLLLPPDVV